MYCTQREHLLARYESALRAYRAAVEELRRQLGAGFEQANQEADRLHVVVEATREELDSHTHEHGCGYHESGTSS